jgi:FAD/FMN-containing dehydrogenase
MSFPAIQAAFDALYPQGACGDNHEGLAQVKNQYDPDNLFKINQNIIPGG